MHCCQALSTALGDATIFVAFGPLTALSAYLALAQRWSAVAWWPLLYSLPTSSVSGC